MVLNTENNSTKSIAVNVRVSEAVHRKGNHTVSLVFPHFVVVTASSEKGMNSFPPQNSTHHHPRWRSERVFIFVKSWVHLRQYSNYSLQSILIQCHTVSTLLFGQWASVQSYFSGWATHICPEATPNMPLIADYTLNWSPTKVWYRDRQTDSGVISHHLEVGGGNLFERRHRTWAELRSRHHGFGRDRGEWVNLI